MSWLMHWKVKITERGVCGAYPATPQPFNSRTAITHASSVSKWHVSSPMPATLLNWQSGSLNSVIQKQIPKAGVHFSKKNIHGSRSIHSSHLEKVKCETRISLHGFLLIKFREKCEMRVYIFRWSIWEVRNVKFCVKRELIFWKNGLLVWSNWIISVPEEQFGQLKSAEIVLWPIRVHVQWGLPKHACKARFCPDEIDHTVGWTY